MNKEESKEVVKGEGILGRHHEGTKFNIGMAFLELDQRVKLLEEAMMYLAEIEKTKLGISEKTDKLIMPDRTIIGPEHL